jgi:hypothetical protein
MLGNNRSEKHKIIDHKVKMSLDDHLHPEGTVAKNIKRKVIEEFQLSQNLNEPLSITVTNNRYGIYNIADAQWSEYDPIPSHTNSENYIVGDEKLEIYNIETTNHRSTYLKSYVIDKKARPEMLCLDIHNLQYHRNLNYLREIYSFCSEIFEYKDFEDFFWSTIEDNFSKLFPDGSSKTILSGTPIDLAIIVLEKYLNSKGLYSRTTEEILKYFLQFYKPAKLKSLSYILKKRMELLCLQVEKYHEYNALHGASSRSMKGCVTAYDSLLSQIEQFQDEPSTIVTNRIELLKYIFNDSAVNLNQIDTIVTGLHWLTFWNQRIYEKKLDEKLFGPISSVDQADIKRIILEVTSECIFFIIDMQEELKYMEDINHIDDRHKNLIENIFDLYREKFGNIFSGSTMTNDPETEIPENVDTERLNTLPPLEQGAFFPFGDLFKKEQ